MQSNPFHEPVSMKAKRLNVHVEHFVGYSLICEWCEKPFRCFREFEPFCGGCRDLRDSNAGK